MQHMAQLIRYHQLMRRNRHMRLLMYCKKSFFLYKFVDQLIVRTVIVCCFYVTNSYISYCLIHLVLRLTVQLNICGNTLLCLGICSLGFLITRIRLTHYRKKYARMYVNRQYRKKTG